MLAKTELIWATPNGDKIIADLARVSNPKNQGNDETAPRLINYLIQHRHWSPFEMASMCVCITTTRDIGRQILRHRSFSFQEFSGRYAEYEELAFDREARGQDPKNRQNSIIYDAEANSEQAGIIGRFAGAIQHVGGMAASYYKAALQDGVAKECARALLPEGMVPTTMYMTGTIRSWIHYINERTEQGVQREHRVLAEQIAILFARSFPMVYEATQLPTAAQEREQALVDMLGACRAQFLIYEKNHLDKGTPESAEKAIVNANFAASIEKLIGPKADE